MPGRILIVPRLFQDDGAYLDRFAAGGGQDWALLATRSLLERWREELLARSPRRALGGERLMLFAGLARTLLGPGGPRPASEIVRRTVISLVLARLQREGKLRALGSLACTPTLPGELLLAIGELKRGKVPRGMLAAGGSLLLDDVDLVWREYERDLAAAGWVEEDDLPALATDAVAAGNADACRSLLVHGFTDFSPLQAGLLEALAGCGAEVTILLPQPESLPRVAEVNRAATALFSGWELSGPRFAGAAAARETPPTGAGHAGARVVLLTGEGTSALHALLARTIHARLRDDAGLAPEAIAIVRRDPSPADPLPHALRRYGLPVRGQSGPCLLGLNATGLVLAALDCLAHDWPRRSVLRLARGIFTRDESHLADALAACSSRFRIVRTRAAWEDLPDLACAAGGEENGTREREGAAVREAMSRLADVLRILPAEGTTAAYLEALRAMLEALQLPRLWRPGSGDDAALAAYAAEMRGLTLLMNALAEAAAAEDSLSAARRWTAESLGAELRRMAAGLYLPARPGQEGIRCLGPSEIRGLRFRLVFLVGLAEGEFPKPYRENWLLPEESRLKLRGDGFGLDSRAALADREWRLLANVMAAATDTLYLAWSSMDAGGEAAAPSLFLSHLREEFQPPEIRLPAGELLPGRVSEAWDRAGAVGRLLADLLWREPDAAEEPALLAAYNRHRTEIAACLARAGIGGANQGNKAAAAVLRGADILAELARRFGPERVLSVSELEDYAGCPYVFFARRLLGLEEFTEPEEEPSGLDLGQAYHAALEEFFSRAGAEGLDAGRLGEYERMLDEAVRKAFAGLFAKARTTVTRRLLQMGERLCLKRLSALVRREAGAAGRGRGWRTVHCELGFGLARRGGLDPASSREPLLLGAAGGEVRIAGKLDRVDLHAEGCYAVYDYKLGRPPETRRILDGQALQIPVYLLAAARIFFPGQPPAGGGYYSLRDLERQAGLWRTRYAALTGISNRAGGSLTEEEWEEAMAALEARVVEAARGIRGGDFRPTVAECPPYCRFRPICRKEGGRA
ncbi:MAG: PD-(D/E)XK nuclease family protein [Patescibacteria group bacterium]